MFSSPLPRCHHPTAVRAGEPDEVWKGPCRSRCQVPCYHRHSAVNPLPELLLSRSWMSPCPPSQAEGLSPSGMWMRSKRWELAAEPAPCTATLCPVLANPARDPCETGGRSTLYNIQTMYSDCATRENLGWKSQWQNPTGFFSLACEFTASMNGRERSSRSNKNQVR